MYICMPHEIDHPKTQDQAQDVDRSKEPKAANDMPPTIESNQVEPAEDWPTMIESNQVDSDDTAAATLDPFAVDDSVELPPVEALQLKQKRLTKLENIFEQRWHNLTNISMPTRVAIQRFYNYKFVTAVQGNIVNLLPASQDLLVKAKAGSGKT
ncbi:hypothetical protein HDV05_006132, partial [Chytridiales sp. JEL 0842]